MTSNAAFPRAASWEETRTRLDQNAFFSNMRGTPYYREAVYEQFSAQEYARRYKALRSKMADLGLAAVIVPGGPSHWSFGGGMLWLSGHWEWHALACYVLVPLDGEPTLIYSMSGTHCEAVRREVAAAITDVRPARKGRYGEVMVERLKELGLERGRIGLLEVDPTHSDYLPVNQYNTLVEGLPAAEIVFTRGIMHELLSVHSAEELDCVRKAGALCQAAIEAVAARARPGVPEYKLRAAAGAAILEGGGDIDFLIIGSTPTSDPAQVFGNPRPSRRVLQKGDLINMELAAGYRGYSAQIGSPICVGEPPAAVRRFWEEIAKPGFERIVAQLVPGNSMEKVRAAGDFFREKGMQSRPIHVHGIDFVSDSPHIFKEVVHAESFERELRPGMVLMPEPTAITADGLLGMFVGHTFIITETGHECVDRFPLELVVTG
jgi:Xaa-Pro aminopeptidase